MPAAYLTFDRPDGLTDTQWDKLAGKAKQIVKAETPVRTGWLRSSWELLSLNDHQVRLKTNDTAPYASYVNDGTPRMYARDFTGAAEARLSDLASEMTK